MTSKPIPAGCEDIVAELQAALRESEEHIEWWRKNGTEMDAEIARIRAAIENAPHGGRCASFGLRVWDPGKCNCWKREALKDD